MQCLNSLGFTPPHCTIHHPSWKGFWVTQLPDRASNRWQCLDSSDPPTSACNRHTSSMRPIWRTCGCLAFHPFGSCVDAKFALFWSILDLFWFSNVYGFIDLDQMIDDLWWFTWGKTWKIHGSHDSKLGLLPLKFCCIASWSPAQFPEPPKTTNLGHVAGLGFGQRFARNPGLPTSCLSSGCRTSEPKNVRHPICSRWSLPVLQKKGNICK